MVVLVEIKGLALLGNNPNASCGSEKGGGCTEKNKEEKGNQEFATDVSWAHLIASQLGG